MAQVVGKVGNITRDPVIGVSPKGKTYVRFGLAVNPYVPKGQPKPDPIFYEITAFDALADNVAECLEKGARVVVVGRPSIQTWTDKEGKDQKTKKIIADGIGPDLRFAKAAVEKIAATVRQEEAEPVDEDF